MTPFPQSPFWRRLSGSEPLDQNSNTIVSKWAADMGGQLYFGAQDSWSHPIYNGCASEYPSFKIELIENWGPTTQGKTIKLASTARPEGMQSISSSGAVTLVPDGDGHLSVIEKDGYQYDFWQVRQLGNGIIRAQFGNRSLMSGNGFGGGSVLNHVLGLGDIRGQDLKAEVVNQGLFAITKQSNGQRNVAEFGPGGSGANSGFATNRPAMGQRLQLRMTDSQIDAYSKPWERLIAKRFKNYGIIIGDTGGGCLKGESPLPWKTTGQIPPLVDYGQKLGNNGNFRMNVDWSKVVAIKVGS